MYQLLNNIKIAKNTESLLNFIIIATFKIETYKLDKNDIDIYFR